MDALGAGESTPIREMSVAHAERHGQLDTTERALNRCRR